LIIKPSLDVIFVYFFNKMLIFFFFIFFRASERSPFDGSCCGAGYADLEDSLPPSPTDSEIPPSPR
jgi:hypothetical protein